MDIRVGMGSCGIAAGADEVFRALEQAGLQPKIVGCNGLCCLEPIVTVDNRMYVKVNNIDDIINNKLVPHEINRSENLIALRNCGIIDPTDISEYIERGGYKPLGLTPGEIIALVKTSGLSGRGGAGFPTWFKWQAAQDAAGDKKYVICNADEGDPGAFMDRAILEGDPHSVIEGMIICARAIGADEGIIYVRAEYPLAVQRLETAIEQARERGFLNDIFNVRIKAGAGAFVCGEETALIASLEGERGMPRLKPPFPAQKGFRGQPSNINNVETFANIPWIIANPGKPAHTKVFALTGKVARGGLAEVQMGMTIRELLDSVEAGDFKAVQLGGPSGGCIPSSLADTLITYQALAETGAIMGSGGMVVMDESTCMVDMARFFLDFTCKESCGKCTHCRVGNRRLLEILERICTGKGHGGDMELLEELSHDIKAGSLCALGQTAPNPVLTTLRYFRNEYEDHVYRKKCTAGSCKALLTYTIDIAQCRKCNLCERKCPASAITDLVINADKCTKCGLCADICKFGAVNVS